MLKIETERPCPGPKESESLQILYVVSLNVSCGHPTYKVSKLIGVLGKDNSVFLFNRIGTIISRPQAFVGLIFRSAISGPTTLVLTCTFIVSGLPGASVDEALLMVNAFLSTLSII